MNPVHRAVVLATLSTCAMAAEERLPGPWTVQVGWSVLLPGAGNVAGNKGLVIGGGWRDGQDGLIGRRGIDVQYRAAQRATGRLDDLSAAYVERIPWQSQVYGGVGAGLWASRLADRRGDGEGVRWNAAPGVKGIVGYQFPPPADDLRLALELAVLAVMPVRGFSAGGATIGLVAGF